MSISERGSMRVVKLAQGVAVAAVVAVMAVPVVSHLGGDTLLGATSAQAQEHSGGHSGGEGGHSGGEGGHSGGEGGQGGGEGSHSGGKGGHGDVQDEGHDGGDSGHDSGKGGSSKGGSMGGASLGRLNMARALLSPGFDETKIDDDEAPLKQIVKYRNLMSAGKEETWQEAARALANAATAPISVTTVQKLNKLLGISYGYEVSIAEFAAYAQSLNTNEEH